MLKSRIKSRTDLPTAKDLPDSDGQPLDNELHAIMPHLLRSILALIWADRYDWFFGTNMGWYYDPDQNCIVPDGFLSIGVSRILDHNLRLSYLTWRENDIIPSLTIEIVSKTPGGEYKKKKQLYAELGVLYYIVYAPNRIRKPRLTIYKLQNGEYELCSNNPIWMPEIGLGIGIELGTYNGIHREWLYWYNQQGERYLTPDEIARQEEFSRKQSEQALFQEQKARLVAQQARLDAEDARLQAEEKAAKLEEKLRKLGIDID